jgi:hypothetical protein
MEQYLFPALGSRSVASLKVRDLLAPLNTALASTGNSAGLTAEQLRSSSLFSTEQIVAAENRLLSYSDVAAEEFPLAMEAVVDQVSVWV